MKSDLFEAHMKGLRELIEEKFHNNRGEHEAILVQTTKTNGRVTALETWKNQVQGGFNLIKWVGIGNVVLFIGLIITMLKKNI